MHESILVEAFLSFFQNKTIRVFVDGTVGAGGHAKAILEAHPEIEILYGLDRDTFALEIAAQALNTFGKRVKLIHGNFSSIKEIVPEKEVDAIFLDIGVSSMQLDLAEKGFSFNKEGPLDMRMDQTQNLTAEKVVNTYSEKELGKIFKELGEEPRWRSVAKAIVEGRKKKKIKTTMDLTLLLRHVLTWGGRRGKKIHPMTLVFQALRIHVNNELGAIEQAIPECIDFLGIGGRFGVISFHSLEDRIVKQRFKEHALEKKVVLLTKKPVQVDAHESARNPRSRSAKMRFVEKLG